MKVNPDGPKIQQAREARGWSQQDLASKAGLSYKTVWAAEQGLPVRPSTLTVIALALGMKAPKLEVAS